MWSTRFLAASLLAISILGESAWTKDSGLTKPRSLQRDALSKKKDGETYSDKSLAPTDSTAPRAMTPDPTEDPNYTPLGNAGAVRLPPDSVEPPHAKAIPSPFVEEDDIRPNPAKAPPVQPPVSSEPVTTSRPAPPSQPAKSQPPAHPAVPPVPPPPQVAAPPVPARAVPAWEDDVLAPPAAPLQYPQTPQLDMPAYSEPPNGYFGKNHVVVGGWLDHGTMINGGQPVDRYNGVVTFPDRDGEWQMNQLWGFMERTAQTGDGWDWGGRVDMVYGTDARFTQAAGLETAWDQTARFYQVALPQFYVDVAYEDWTVRFGHFFTLLGYEVVPAPNNFFYTHSYSMQYGEPFTHTGATLSRKFGNVTAVAGLHRGNDQFTDQDGRNALDFLGGLNFTSDDERFSLAFGLTATEQGPTIDQTIYSLVGTWKVTEQFRFILQHDLGATSDSAGVASGQWASVSQYFLYDINAEWATGLRVEWFEDNDGTRVTGLGDGNAVRGASFAGSFTEITWGVNWRPRPNIILRPECRWDWFNGESRTPGIAGPFDAGRDNNQFLVGTDVLITF